MTSTAYSAKVSRQGDPLLLPTAELGAELAHRMLLTVGVGETPEVPTVRRRPVALLKNVRTRSTGGSGERAIALSEYRNGAVPIDACRHALVSVDLLEL